MRREIANFNGTEARRVERRKAKKFYDEGKRIWILPEKANPGSLMFEGSSPFVKTEDKRSFEKLVNEYSFYNCNKELGTYVKYFVAENDIEEVY